MRKLGITPLDSACKGDLSYLAACQACKDSGDLVERELVKMYTNLTTLVTSKICYYFTCLHAARVANEFGPKTQSTAQCVLRLPFVQTMSRGQVMAYCVMGAAAALLICALGLLYCLWARKRSRKVEPRGFARRNEEHLKSSVKPNTGAVWFDIEEIKAATDNFSEAKGASLLWTGERFLTVGGLHNDREGHQRFLIYDYMLNGTLNDHIFGEKSKPRPLSWSQRKNLILGIAKGLAYLRDGTEHTIYHRDIKPTSVLLDDEMNACVADFGLARIMAKEEGKSHETTRIARMHDYFAPKYALYGRLTDKSDVYSFSVVLLEIMSGRKALDTSADCASHYLITDWGWRRVKEGRTNEIIDERI
eukprot:PITA_33303